MRFHLLAAAFAVGLCAPAMAYGTRDVQHNQAEELARMTGAEAYPLPQNNIPFDPGPVPNGAELAPHHVLGLPHNGIEVEIGGSAAYPVITQGAIDHPPGSHSTGRLVEGFATMGQQRGMLAGDYQAPGG